MKYIFLREIFSETAKWNTETFLTLLGVLVLVALAIVLIYVFRKSLDDFFRISDAELYVNKKGSKKTETSSTSKTQSMRALKDDPEKTTNMKMIDLPRKSKKGE